jgi:hypothetical protein
MSRKRSILNIATPRLARDDLKIPGKGDPRVAITSSVSKCGHPGKPRQG